jgi:hypothetical protein
MLGINITVISVLFLCTPASAIARKGNFIGTETCSTTFSKNMGTMSLPQCYEKCGTGWAPYGKLGIIVSILAWVVPLFVLIGNMHFSHFDVRILESEENPYWI